MPSLVVAIGGNALPPPAEAADLARMHRRVQETAKALAELADGQIRLVVTHGNGPQVGHLLAQTQEARGRAPAPLLDVVVAQTRGQIGYHLHPAVRKELARTGRDPPVTTVVTQVLVDADAPAFHNPTKPIGPTISSE